MFPGREEEALDAQDRALALHPGIADWLINRGMILQGLSGMPRRWKAWTKPLRRGRVTPGR